MKLSKTRVGATALTMTAALVLAGCGNDDSGGHDMGSMSTGAAPATTTTTGATTANAVDQAFVRQMVPHHEMAVEMAKIARNQGERDEITTLADEVIAAQDAEIEEMRTIAAAQGVELDAMAGMDHSQHAGGGADATVMDADLQTLDLTPEEAGMAMNMAALTSAASFDREFIDQMIPHHQGAIRMARVQLEQGENPELRRISRAIVAAQEREIEQMNAWRKDWYGRASPAGGSPPA